MDEKILQQVKELPRHHQKQILEIVQLLAIGIKKSKKKHNITELRGCGKSIWKDIDAQEYVSKLREEWH
ncbi:MAG: hypothetical protein A2Y62_21605 [Candidatus Fischerbacteria bacterium RBG_13_37_8]|uniref:DUF2281 domain-containing protein n=1 Tax=Candidatus Fischerbacteria bacterium RBG_13_37_8 TaxID=1817863 RepID=A0A1F5VK81_9BACT|nr:MAG: hypothetical protein A2Y62_21605 [Candidatus Fischerbacteria bacterium RBG_13_37_8]